MSTSSIHDFVLVSRVTLFGDKQAFGKLVDAYQGSVRRLFMKQTQGNKTLSDDLAQETFIRAYLNIHSFKATAQFSTWLYRIAYNTFLENRRKNKNYESDTDILESTQQPKIDESMDINTAMKLLRREEQLCITLSLVEGIPHKDIAEITGMPIGTIKTHILRGKEKLRTFLKQ